MDNMHSVVNVTVLMVLCTFWWLYLSNFYQFWWECYSFKWIHVQLGGRVTASNGFKYTIVGVVDL